MSQNVLNVMTDMTNKGYAGTMDMVKAVMAADGNYWRDLSGGGGSGDSGYNAFKPTTPPTTTDPNAPKPLTEADNFFKDAPEWSYYQPMDANKMQANASEFANVYAQPQYQQLEAKLQQAITDAAAQEERIRGAFAGTESMYARRENEQARRDLESAISRGAGRSGVVPFMGIQRQEHFSELLAAEEAKKNAELYAIANQLGLVQRQVPEQRMQIAEQAGRLTNQELQRLQDLEYSRRREHDLDQWERNLSVFDRTRLTPLEQLTLYLQMAVTMGTTPAIVPSVTGSFG